MKAKLLLILLSALFIVPITAKEAKRINLQYEGIN